MGRRGRGGGHLVVSGREMVSALELVGFERRRTRGDHAIMRHPDGRGTTVPMHR
jgi:predicted RNA binding protein YcfA (HicA-like mRNA interferase family)